MARIAVVDVETTGLNPYLHHRVVEIAVVVIHHDGKIVHELATLVNPERDMGPTSIHGLTTRDVLEAPRFSEIAGTLLEVLDGCVAVAGHNVRFDHSFLAVEYDRIGYRFPDGPTLCTMHLAGGGSLVRVCSDYGISFDGQAHAALHDARATAQLLATLLRDAPRQSSKLVGLPPIAWPDIPKSQVRLLTRDGSRMRQSESPTYLQKLLTRLQPALPPDDQDSAILAYTSLLDRVLEDRNVDEAEGQALFDVATRWAITGEQIQKAHWDYLLSLAAAALADGTVTDAERRDLLQVSYLLGIDSVEFDKVLLRASLRLSEIRSQPYMPVGAQPPGEYVKKYVCFTGECQCRLKDRAITREVAEELATQHGMFVTESVIKKLDLLVVADPLTQSGKAKKARQYGIRIVHEPVFWRALGLEVG